MTWVTPPNEKKSIAGIVIHISEQLWQHLDSPSWQLGAGRQNDAKNVARLPTIERLRLLIIFEFEGCLHGFLPFP